MQTSVTLNFFHTHMQKIESTSLERKKEDSISEEYQPLAKDRVHIFGKRKKTRSPRSISLWQKEMKRKAEEHTWEKLSEKNSEKQISKIRDLA